MPATTAGSHLGLDTHANRPAANAAGQPVGALYSCSTHGLVYKTDGSTWATWATLGTAASGSITASGYTQSTAKILGRSTASTGAIEEIGVGTGLSLAGGTLSATGGGGGTITTGGAVLSGGVVNIASMAAFTDVLSASLAAGTWIGFATLMCLQTAGGTSGWDAKIWESGGPTVYGAGDVTVAAGVGLRAMLSIVTQPFVLGGTTTVKISVRAQGNPNLSVSDVTTVGTAKASNLLFIKTA